jgi:hypothetical protein
MWHRQESVTGRVSGRHACLPKTHEEIHDCDSRVRRSCRAVDAIHELFDERFDLRLLRKISLARQTVRRMFHLKEPSFCRAFLPPPHVPTTATLENSALLSHLWSSSRWHFKPNISGIEALRGRGTLPTFRVTRQCPSCAFDFSSVMSCRASHSFDGSNAATPVNSSFEA